MVNIEHDIILNVVKDVLERSIGETASHVLYDYIRKKYGMKLKDAVKNPKIFLKILRDIFGVGAEKIEYLILKDLENVFSEEINLNLREKRLLQAEFEELSMYLKLFNNGFTEYESRIYTALILFGKMNARKLSMITKIPRTKIYNAINRLIELNYVRERKENGVSYFIPEDPEKVLGPFLDTIRSRLKICEDILNRLSYYYGQKFSKLGTFENISVIEIPQE